MNALRIENLRSLKDTGVQKLSPLTILLGNNSSGKSTFLRTLPLLKQSFQDKILGPITFFGSLVDFGDFKTALTKNSTEKNISITLNFCIDEKDLFFFRERDKTYDNSFPIELKLIFDKYEKSDVIYISYCKINLLDENIELSFSEDNFLKSLVLNDIEYLESNLETTVFYRDGRFFPSFHNSQETMYLNHNVFNTHFIRFYEDLYNYKKDINKEKNIVSFGLRNFDYFPIYGKSLQLADLNHFIFQDSFPPEIIKEFESKEIDFNLFSEYLFLSQIPRVLTIIEKTLSREMKNLFYSKPLRANAERYYRIQPLAVDEVSADGRNLISFINNLTKTQRQKFESWIDSNFDFKISIKPYEGHQSLLIKNKDDDEFSNISDMGFGYSQIIPIITQLWAIQDKISNHEEKLKLLLLLLNNQNYIFIQKCKEN